MAFGTRAPAIRTIRTRGCGRTTVSRVSKGERRAFRGRRHDLVREPSAGNPPAGFDERRLETGLRRGVRHRHRESRRQPLPPIAYRYRASCRLYKNRAGTFIRSVIPAPPGNTSSPPGVTSRSSVPCRSQTPWVRRVGKNAFATVLPARPCPVFGRPIHRGAAPSITARYFSASPSDSTSRWTPCPPVRLTTASQLSATLGRIRRFRLRARLGSRVSTHPGQ